jgi:inhibitor of KinA sporulation pathway (predicted exonuclease)
MDKIQQFKEMIVEYLNEVAAGEIRKKYTAKAGGPKRVRRSTNLSQAARNSGQSVTQRKKSAIKRNKTKRKLHGRVVTKQQIRKTARAMRKRPD